MKPSLALIVLLLLIGCSEPEAPTQPRSLKGAFTDSHICKAAIAKVMGKQPSLISLDESADNAIYLSYTKKNEQKTQSYQCNIKDLRILWGVKNGPWRDGEHDSRLLFSVKDKTLTITEHFTNGLEDKQSFQISDLR